MCLCVLGLDDRAEGMKGMERQKRKKLKRKTQQKEAEGKWVIQREKEIDFCDADRFWP